MAIPHLTAGSVLIATAGLVVGLALPAAAHEARHLINGTSIAKGSIPGNRLKANGLTGKQIKESTLSTVPKATSAGIARKLTPLAWHTITSFQHSWSASDLPQGPPAYAVDAEGVIHFKGAVSGGSEDSVAFTLPPSVVKPSATINLPIACEDATSGQVEISEDAVTIEGNSAEPTEDCIGASYLQGLTFAPS